MSPVVRPSLRWVRPPQQTRSQETLDRILDAAELLVGEKGFDDATVAEIVRRAGSSVGAFYTRFPDKDALLYALYERFVAQAIATADAALDAEAWRDSGVAVLLESVLRFLVQVYRDHQGLLTAFVVRAHSDAEFHVRYDQLSSYVERKLSALLLERRAEISHPEPELAASFGLTVALGTIENAVLFAQTSSAKLTLSDEQLAAELTRAYLAYLGAGSAPTPRIATH